jgi:hypothetical protein
MAESPRKVREAFERGVKKALLEGMRGVYLEARKNVRENLSGRIMNKRTGRTLRNVMRQSKMTRDGFKLATTAPGLQAWMKGSRRKGYWVLPINARMLAWRDKQTGQMRFSRGHYIHPWTFAPKRPVFEDAIARIGQAGVLRAYKRSLGPSLRQTFRGGKLTIRLVTPGGS